MVSATPLYIFLVLLLYAEGATQESCTTPNEETALCVPLHECPILSNALKTLNDTIIDFVKKSVCRAVGDVRYVCCGTSSHLEVDRCVTPNQENGKCMRLESCSVLFEGVKALNRTVFDFATRSACKTEGDDQYVCCGTLSYLLQTTTTTTRSLTSMTTTTEKPDKGLLSNRKYCGFQHTDDRFYNEDDMAIGEFPWVALLIHENDTVKDQQHCLGALINNRYVVTTAVCVNNTYDDAGFKVTHVRLGEYNASTTQDCISNADYEECSEPVIKVTVEETVLHPNYKLDIKGISFNIALIRLANKINYSDYVRPICLPDLDYRAQIGDNLTTTGWGTTVWELDVDKTSKIKKRGSGIVSPLKECVEKAELNLEGVVSETYHICFSEGATESCADDSSAPLMSKRKNQWQLEGVLSFPTSRKCTEGVLNIYANISSHMQWIVDTVRP